MCFLNAKEFFVAFNKYIFSIRSCLRNLFNAHADVIFITANVNFYCSYKRKASLIKLSTEMSSDCFIFMASDEALQAVDVNLIAKVNKYIITKLQSHS